MLDIYFVLALISTLQFHCVNKTNSALSSFVFNESLKWFINILSLSHQMPTFFFAYDTKIITTFINTAFAFCIKLGAIDCSPLSGLPVKAEI